MHCDVCFFFIEAKGNNSELMESISWKDNSQVQLKRLCRVKKKNNSASNSGSSAKKLKGSPKNSVHHHSTTVLFMIIALAHGCSVPSMKRPNVTP